MLRFRPYSYGNVAAMGGASYDADAQAWFDAVVGAGGSVSTARKAIVDTLVAGLKSDSLWTLLDRLWLFAAENSTSALIDLKGLTTATATNSPTFTADQGYAGNGTTSYVNTGYTPSTHGVAMTQNSAHLSAYDRTSRTTTSGFPYALGYNNATGSIGLLMAAGFSLEARINQAASGGWTFALTNAQGYYIGVRSGSGSGNGAVYKNGSSQTLGGGSASNGLGAGNIHVCTMNGAAGTFTTDQIAAVTLGGALDATQAGNLSSRINAYMTSLGTNVY